jgi:hypothetical protein
VITAEEVARSPTWLPLELTATDAVRLLRLDEAAYRAASFLDRRTLAANPELAMCEAAVLEAAGARLTPRSHYIFHIGHVGSTLISRLVGEHQRLFSVREPALLREMAVAAGNGTPPQGGAGTAARMTSRGAAEESTAARQLSLGALLRLLARSWRDEQRAVIKPTSFVSELASIILASSQEPAAIFMYAQPAAYLRGILGGPNSRIEAQTLAPTRVRRLARRLGSGDWQAHLASEGEYLAMSWLCEMAALHEAASKAREPGSASRAWAQWVDFDDFLTDPAVVLSQIFRTLGASPAASEIEALVSGPLMRQYSKAPEHAYDADLRREVLAAADRQYGAEIGRGMHWLHRMAMHHPLVAQILDTR